MIWLIAFLLVTAGVVLKVSARFGQRIGTAPHCKRCGYRLTGVDSDRCPECGAELAKGNVAVGRRPDNRTQKRVGVMAILAGLLILAVNGYRQLERTDWYHYRPAEWLVEEVLSDATSRHLAWAEINRRCDTKQWPPDADAKLIAAAMVEQAKPADARIVAAEPLMKYLGKRFASNALTADQVDKYLDQVFISVLEVRTKVALGDPAVCELYVGPPVWGAPAPDDISVVGRQQLYLDDVPLDGRYGVDRSPVSLAAFAVMTGVRPIPVETLGRHTISAKVKVEFYRRTHEGGKPVRTLVKIRDIHLEAPFEVMDPKVEDPITMPNCVGRRFGQPSVDVRLWHHAITAGGVSAEVEIKRPPVNVAFDVFLRSRSVEQPLGRAQAWPSRWITMHLIGDLGGLPPTDRVDVVLRSSRDAAATTLDLYQIWGGEFVIPDVVLQGERSELDE